MIKSLYIDGKWIAVNGCLFKRCQVIDQKEFISKFQEFCTTDRTISVHMVHYDSDCAYFQDDQGKEYVASVHYLRMINDLAYDTFRINPFKNMLFVYRENELIGGLMLLEKSEK